MVEATPCPLYPRERDPVPIAQEAGWAPGLVWTDGFSDQNCVKFCRKPQEINWHLKALHVANPGCRNTLPSDVGLLVICSTRPSPFFAVKTRNPSFQSVFIFNVP